MSLGTKEGTVLVMVDGIVLRTVLGTSLLLVLEGTAVCTPGEALGAFVGTLVNEFGSNSNSSIACAIPLLANTLMNSTGTPFTWTGISEAARKSVLRRGDVTIGSVTRSPEIVMVIFRPPNVVKTSPSAHDNDEWTPKIT